MVTAVVTGATAGIGRAFVDRLARDGMDVVLVARDTVRLDEVATEVSAATGVATEMLAADLADRDGCARVEARLTDPDRPVDLLVNNAGFGLNAPFLDAALDDQERQLDVLVRAVLRLTHAAGTAMAARGTGQVINVASVAAFVPYSTYSAHKAWVTTFSQAIADELAGHGVTVMALCPGFVRTEFHERAEMDMGGIPSWGWLEADDLVDQALADLRRGRTVSIPDARYKTVVGLTRLLPGTVVGRIARKIRD